MAIQDHLTDIDTVLLLEPTVLLDRLVQCTATAVLLHNDYFAFGDLEPVLIYLDHVVGGSLFDLAKVFFQSGI